MKNKLLIVFLLICFFSPSFVPVFSANDVIESPATITEAKNLMMEILQGLPGAIKNVWEEKALPLWQRMWNWFKPYLNKWWNKLLELLGREVKKIQPEIEEKIEKTEKSLWQRFKNLFD